MGRGERQEQTGRGRAERRDRTGRSDRSGRSGSPAARSEDGAIERLRSGGVELAVRHLTAEEPPVGQAARLILLHGGPGLDHHLLLPLGTLLAARHEVWLPDLPGHGASVTSPRRLPGLPALEEQLTTWLRGFPGGFDALIGHSMGAWLLARMLWQRRVAPRAAVLVSPPAAGQERSGTAFRRAVAAMARARKGDPPAGGRRLERARRELHAHVAAETRGAALPAFLAAVDRVAVRDPRGYGALLRDFHRSVTRPVRPFDPGCPVLVLCGDRDATTPPEQARRVAESIAGARLEVVEGAGHYPFAECPEQVAGRLLAFLACVIPERRGI